MKIAAQDEVDAGSGGPKLNGQPALPPVTPLLLNTAGELEREARSRRANGIEVLGFMVWVLGSLWLYYFIFGILPGNLAIRNGGTEQLCSIGIYSRGRSF